MGLTRRQALAVGGGALVATGVGVSATRGREPSLGPWDGRHQAGIRTPPQAHITLAAFDVHTPDRADLRRLLTEWTALAEQLERGERPDPGRRDELPVDTGEAGALAPARLTITIGLGASLFRARYGLAGRAPAGLRPLGALPGEAALAPERSDGDLLVQVCGDDRQVAFHALHRLTSAARGIATPRWIQHGFAGPRNLLGFGDGGAPAQPGRDVWVAEGDAGRDGWMIDGSYLVYRRFRLALGLWDRRTLGDQEHAIGRRKRDGAALAATPADAHGHVVAGAPMLRRSYNYCDGVVDGALDAGLLFICFVADPPRQFAPVRQAMAARDSLMQYAAATAGAVFAIAPAPQRGQPLAAPLLAGR